MNEDKNQRENDSFWFFLCNRKYSFWIRENREITLAFPAPDAKIHIKRARKKERSQGDEETQGLLTGAVSRVFGGRLFKVLWSVMRRIENGELVPMKSAKNNGGSRHCRYAFGNTKKKRIIRSFMRNWNIGIIPGSIRSITENIRNATRGTGRSCSFWAII